MIFNHIPDYVEKGSMSSSLFIIIYIYDIYIQFMYAFLYRMLSRFGIYEKNFQKKNQYLWNASWWLIKKMVFFIRMPQCLNRVKKNVIRWWLVTRIEHKDSKKMGTSTRMLFQTNKYLMENAKCVVVILQVNFWCWVQSDF